MITQKFIYFFLSTIVKQRRTILERFNINRFGIETSYTSIPNSSICYCSFSISMHQRCCCHEKLCAWLRSRLYATWEFCTHFFNSKISTSCSWCSFEFGAEAYAAMMNYYDCSRLNFISKNNNNNRSEHRTYRMHKIKVNETTKKLLYDFFIAIWMLCLHLFIWICIWIYDCSCECKCKRNL